MNKRHRKKKYHNDRIRMEKFWKEEAELCIASAPSAPMTSIELREIVWKQGTERFLELFREQIKIKGKP